MCYFFQKCFFFIFPLPFSGLLSQVTTDVELNKLSRSLVCEKKKKGLVW